MAELQGGHLEIVDASSGAITKTGLDVSSDGLTFDRAGALLMACIFVDKGNCVPSLVDLKSGVTVASNMRGELLNAGELTDGRWIGRNSGDVVVWDPRNPEATVDLGSGWPSVSPSGTVAIISDASSSQTADLVIVDVLGRGAWYPMWSPAGDRIAYSILTGASGQELEIAATP
jgi:hypothetical protein